MKFHYWIPLLTLPLAGCQTAQLSYETPYDNPYNLPANGTVVELHQTLSFSPGNSRSNIQNGTAIGQSGYDRFNPWCQFYLYESKEAMKVSRTIEPDKFTVIHASQNMDYTNLGPILTEPIEVAAMSVGIGFGKPLYFGSSLDDTGLRTMRTTLRLHSEKQPQVHELRCMVDDDPYLRRFVTINQMIKTLGEVATLHLPVVAE